MPTHWFVPGPSLSTCKECGQHIRDESHRMAQPIKSRFWRGFLRILHWWLASGILVMLLAGLADLIQLGASKVAQTCMNLSWKLSDYRYQPLWLLIVSKLPLWVQRWFIFPVLFCWFLGDLTGSPRQPIPKD